MQLHEDLSSQNQLSPPAQSGVENTSQTSAIPGREEEGSERQEWAVPLCSSCVTTPPPVNCLSVTWVSQLPAVKTCKCEKPAQHGASANRHGTVPKLHSITHSLMMIKQNTLVKTRGVESDSGPSPTLGKLHNSCVPQLPDLSNGDKKSCHLIIKIAIVFEHVLWALLYTGDCAWTVLLQLSASHEMRTLLCSFDRWANRFRKGNTTFPRLNWQQTEGRGLEAGLPNLGSFYTGMLGEFEWDLKPKKVCYHCFTLYYLYLLWFSSSCCLSLAFSIK